MAKNTVQLTAESLNDYRHAQLFFNDSIITLLGSENEPDPKILTGAAVTAKMFNEHLKNLIKPLYEE